LYGKCYRLVISYSNYYRRDNTIVASGSLPLHWDEQPTGADGKRKLCHLVTLACDSDEYKRALEKFEDTLPPALYTIVEVRRIQNPQLFQQYNTMKANMKNSVPVNYQLERELFHGTKKEACNDINHQGFNRIFAGTNGMDIIYSRVHQLISYS